MNVLVTGGAGYIGSTLVSALLRRMINVRVLDSLLFGDAGLREYRDRIDLDVADIRDASPDHFEGVDAVVHLAAMSNQPAAEFDQDTTRRINVDATARIASLAKACGVRKFIFASSCSVYEGDQGTPDLRTEACPVSPIATYSWSKRQGEMELLALADHVFCPIVLRFGTVFGSSTRMRYDLVVNTFTADAHARRRVAVHHGGRMWRPLLCVRDAIDAIATVLHAADDRLRAQIFNVLGQNRTVLDVALEMQALLRDLRGVDIEINMHPGGESRSYRVSDRKWQQTFGVPLHRSLSNAVIEMWDALQGGVDATDPIYYNIRWMRGQLGE